MTRRPLPSALATAAIAAIAATLAGCTPRLAPLAGTIAPARLPAARLVPGSQKIIFTWQLDDQELSARGEGAARVTAPDSVRLDFFLAGGMGHGAAVLIGDTLHAPGPDFVRSLVPPPPLLWAALGRLDVPALADTAVRVDGAILRADIGHPVAWRVTFRADTLARLDRVENGRVVEWVERAADGQVRYRREGARGRSLRLAINHVEPVPSFDASIWHLD